MNPIIQNYFVLLHNHSEYSLPSGMSSIKKMVAKAKKLGMKHLAITDNGTMFGAIYFYKECRANDINPIIGCEIYLKQGNPRLTILAKNYTGYRNLMVLSSGACTEGSTYKPIIGAELLIPYSSDLICISTCRNEDTSNYNSIEVNQWVENFQSVFGKENFYLELQDCGKPEQKNINKEFIKLSKETGIPLVATNNIHYLEKEDSKALDIPEALTNTVKIAESCKLEIQFPGPLLPDYPIPEEFDSPEDYLRFLVHKGLSVRYSEITDKIRNRINYELDIIINMGFTDYFLIVWDYVNYARENNISVGPGRGSSAGSLVAYALMITDIDPLKYGLMFERFINPERIAIPDIDVDFCFNRQQEVIDYVIQKYGRDRVCHIIVFETSKTSGVIRDISSHSAGIVIARTNLTDYAPLYRDPKTGSILTQYTMDILEDCGLVKFDFMGSQILTDNKKIETLIKENYPDFKISNIPIDDEDTLDIFRNGNTKDIFQFAISAMQDNLKKLNPDSIEDLIALYALYWSGALQFIPIFIDCKNKREAIIFPDSSLKDILKPTYGVIVFQEQLMEIIRKISGFSLGRADILRRAIGKKKVEIVDRMKIEFISGSVLNGYSRKKTDDIFEMLVPYSGYVFNKSHAAAYTLIAYKTAYLKAHYPGEFETVHNYNCNRSEYEK